jgi:hypothetical protein
MESRNRNVWIVIVAAILILCCCLVVAAGLAIGLLTNWTQGFAGWTGWGAGLITETVEHTFEVGTAPTLNVNSFAGDVVVRSATVDTIQVMATKRAPSTTAIRSIQVDFEQQEGQVRVQTRRPGAGAGNISVRLEILTPPGTQLQLSLGAGTVDVRGLTGGVQVNSGAGNVDIRAAEGQVRVDLGAGNINYEGIPSGDCRLNTGAGNIDINLRPDADVRIDLSTNIGNLTVSRFEVAGLVSARSAQGTIGMGGEASITARTNAGNVTLR